MKTFVVLAMSMALTLFHSLAVEAGWELLPNSPIGPGRHSDVYFLNPVLGWVVNSDGEVHRTTDGGETWMLQAILPENARSVGFADSLHGWIGTTTQFDPGLFKSSDGGFTWSRVTVFSGPVPGSICGISVVNDSVVYASGGYYGPPRVIKTTDRGGSWSCYALDSLVGTLVDCRFVSSDSGIVVGSTELANGRYGHAVILSTGDGGSTWKTDHVGIREDELCWKISFVGSGIGFVSIEAFYTPGPVYFFKTTNGGKLWEEKIFQANYRDEQGIGFVSDSVGWIGGWSGETYASYDGGNTWALGGPGINVNRFRFLGDTLGYAVGTRVYKYTTDSTSTSIGPDEQPIALSYQLYQNFPNPFNPTTTIRFSLPEMVHVRLSIVDLLGREVALISDGVWSAGDHVVGWDGRNSSGAEVSSGVYVYRMQTADQTLSRKLMLVR